MQLIAQLGLAFATAPCLRHLTLLHSSNSPDHYAKGTQSPYSGRQAPGFRLLQLVSTWFQVLFHSPPGVLFTFPSRYLCTIGRQRVFSLGRWSSRFLTGFLVSRDTRELSRREPASFRLLDFHHLWLAFPNHSARKLVFDSPTWAAP